MSQKDSVRVHARIPYRFAINNAKRLIMTEGCVVQEGSFKLQAFDLSKGGIGVVTKENLANGAFLTFDIGIEDIQYSIMGMVKWKMSDELTHRYGIEFMGTGNMLYRHIDALSKNQSFFHSVDPKHTERRRHERREMIQEVVCSEIFRDGNPDGERITNRVMQMYDLSYQGTRLHSSLKLTVGAVISIQFVKHKKVIALRGKIIWSKYTLKGMSGMKYATGIEFISLKAEDLYTLKNLLS